MIAPLILSLGTRLRWFSLTPWPLSSRGKESPFTIEWYGRWPLEVVWTFWSTENSFVTAGIRTQDCAVRSTHMRILFFLIHFEFKFLISYSFLDVIVHEALKYRGTISVP